MPTLQIVSDLHLELHADGGTEFIGKMDPSDVDILVLAGDILSLRFSAQVRKLLLALAAKYPKVIYVPGNHEFWRLRPAEGFSVLSTACAGISNLSVLNNQVLSINGRRFLGGTMWFPQWKPYYDYAATEMNDFTEIVDFHPWVVRENAKFERFLDKNLKQGDVVITHYLPSMKSVAARYRGSATNPFFVSQMDRFIVERKPVLWIHGHTHDFFSYQLGDTRIVCNPFGYPFELNPEYREKLLIHID
jgi:predicted phosphodiesterase